MTPKRILYRTTIRLLEQVCLLHPLRRCRSYNLEVAKVAEKESTDVVTVAFNNENIIRHQIRYIKKQLLGHYTYIVADNSTDKAISEKIRLLCQEHGVPYIRLPKNHLRLIGPSYSHATALNWIYRHIIKKRQPTYFGFIDHDLFPICPISIPHIMGEAVVYGPKRERGGFWYLSAIMSFYKFSHLKDKKVDFMPVTLNGVYLDTGGGNYGGIYAKTLQAEAKFVTEKVESFAPGNLRHQDQVEIFDNRWLHTINGSYWKQVESKEEKIEALIVQYETMQATENQITAP